MFVRLGRVRIECGLVSLNLNLKSGFDAINNLST